MISSEFNPTAVAVVYIVDYSLFINPRDLGAIARRSQSSGRRDTVAGQALKFPPRGGHEKALWNPGTVAPCPFHRGYVRLRRKVLRHRIWFPLTGKRRRVYPAHDYRNSRTLSRFTEAIGVYTPSRSSLYPSPLFPFAKCPRVKWFTAYLLFCFSSEAISFCA